MLLERTDVKYIIKVLVFHMEFFFPFFPGFSWCQWFLTGIDGSSGNKNVSLGCSICAFVETEVCGVRPVI